MHNAVSIWFMTGENVRIYEKNYSVFAWYVHLAYFKVYDRVTNAD